MKLSLCLLFLFFIFTPKFTSADYVSPPFDPIHQFNDIAHIKRAIAYDFGPRMVKVINCESSFDQYDSKGNVLESKTHDYGLMEIHNTWIPKAQELGFDIMTIQGNYYFGLWIYKHEGINSWSCNRKV